MSVIQRGYTFDDVTLVPNFGNESREEGTVETALGEHKYLIPLISANMDTITGAEMAVAMAKLGGLGILHRFIGVEENVVAFKKVKASLGTPVVGVSVGLGEDEQDRAAALYKAGARLFCVDVAHAHSKRAGRTVKHLRAEYPDLYIIAGNVATYAGADYLVSVGADAVKVGIGAGSVCTTRRVTGFGVPQLSAIMDCAKVNAPLIADGGIRAAGDAVKAIAAGASMVMLGRLLAGTDEACGATAYRGMASTAAREDYYKPTAGWRAAEGIAVSVEARGPVADVIAELVAGIKSGLSYAGAKNLGELRRKAQFIEVTNAGMIEGTPHALG